MQISKEIGIDVGHRVPFHKSKCRGFHGHRYRIEVGVDDVLITKGSSEGMVIDFGDLKEVMMEEIDGKLDHTSIYFINDPMAEVLKLLEPDSPKPFVWVHFIPTAENLAKYLFKSIKELLRDRGIKIDYVKVWETPTSTATYREANAKT